MNEPGALKIRASAAAGRFYPGNARELRHVVDALLEEAPKYEGASPKAIISPHAGYLYSGPVAASAYGRFLPERERIKRIVLVGPSHFAAFDGLAASSAEAFETPLGLTRVDTTAVRELLRMPQVTELDMAHRQEHALEVQLPFLQVVLPDFTIVPLLVGEASSRQVGEVFDALWGGCETRLVISSDLSHYLDCDTAHRLDAQTAAAVEELRSDAIGDDQACGRLAICGLLESSRRHGLRGEILDLRNSGDTSGPRGRVVGYGAFAFGKPAARS